MTVRELRDFLQAFDDDTPVLVSGYESGYDDPRAIKYVKVAEHSGGWYVGRYEQSDGEKSFTALVIPR